MQHIYIEHVHMHKSLVNDQTRCLKVGDAALITTVLIVQCERGRKTNKHGKNMSAVVSGT